MRWFGLYLLALPAYCLVRAAGVTSVQDILTFAIPILLCLSCVVHAVDTRGWRTAVLLFASACVIAFCAELVGSTTGFIFGAYSYTDLLGARLPGGVPWVIPLAWFMVSYPAWCASDFLMAGITDVERGRAARTYLKPLSAARKRSVFSVMHIAVAAFAVTAYDLSLDPRMVADGAWVWRDRGAYFGVPVSNYLGWFATALVIFGVWSVILGWVPASEGQGAVSEHAGFSFLNAYLPVIAYIVLWLGESIAQLAFWGGTTLGVVVFVGMGVVGAPALWRLHGAYRTAAGHVP